MLDLKHALHSINLTEESKQYTICWASPTYQYNKLSQVLNVSPAYFTSLMNDLLHELPPEIHKYIDCIMDYVIIFTHDIKNHKKSPQKLYAHVEKIWHAFDYQQTSHF